MSPPVSGRIALFLDFDGTLVDIAPTPEGVEVAPALMSLIDTLVARLDGAVAVITGRRIADVEHFLGHPLAAAGLHGLEWRASPGEEIVTEPPPPEIDLLRQRVEASGIVDGGVRVEDKGAGFAVHYRAVPEREGVVTKVMDEAVADLTNLQLIHGKMVIEAKRKGRDKGAALRSFMEAAPFVGRTPVFIGDDVTDEDGMRAAQNAGGVGIKVGEGNTVASHRLADVDAVHEYLRRLAEAAGRRWPSG